MEIINPNGTGNPFGDVQPMGCGTDALAPPHTHGGGSGGNTPGGEGIPCPEVDCPVQKYLPN